MNSNMKFQAGTKPAGFNRYPALILTEEIGTRIRGGIMSEELKARTLKVEDLIEYQEGSVVSREIIRKGTGTVTVFAFDKGEGLSEHTAPFDAMVQVIDGKAEITISGSKHILEKGDMIIMPANESHALHAMERFKMILTMIRS